MDPAPLYPCVVFLLVQLQGSGTPRQIQDPAQALEAHVMKSSANQQSQASPMGGERDGEGEDRHGARVMIDLTPKVAN